MMIKSAHTAAHLTSINEPTSESFVVAGEVFQFKFGYYSLDETHGSEHPKDPADALRVTTLMYTEDCR